MKIMKGERITFVNPFTGNLTDKQVIFLADKLKYFAIEGFKKYNTAFFGNLPENKESYNIANDILNFIRNFHNKYGMKFYLHLLEKNFDKERIDVPKIWFNI